MNDISTPGDGPQIPSRIRYLNTDLDLFSAEDLGPLAEALEQRGMRIHFAGADDGSWRAHLEMGDHHETPALTIAAMLAVIEALPAPLRTLWSGCTRREFNIGYDCGREPRPFEQSLPSALLGRAAALGVDLGITIYPELAADGAPDRAA